MIVKQSILVFAVLTFICGGVYPVLVTAIAQIFFPSQAAGSIIQLPDGRGIASELIGQEFSSDGYFWSRPSATLPMSYNAGASSGSNLGPTNPQLLEDVKRRIRQQGDTSRPIPVDLVTSSASGLDPDISPDAARCQIARVSAARHISVEQVESLVNAHIRGRQLGLFGQPRVNVLKLNVALDRVKQ